MKLKNHQGIKNNIKGTHFGVDTQPHARKSTLSAFCCFKRQESCADPFVRKSMPAPLYHYASVQ